MARNSYVNEQIEFILREIERKQAQGERVHSVCRKAGIMGTTYYNWRNRRGAAQLSLLESKPGDF